MLISSPLTLRWRLAGTNQVTPAPLASAVRTGAGLSRTIEAIVAGAETRNLPDALRLWACDPALSIPCPRIRFTSEDSRTRNYSQVHLGAHRADAHGLCAGRWVATIRVTATARPSRAMESVLLIAAGASSASSAYSSITMIGAGMPGDIGPSRSLVAASTSAAVQRIELFQGRGHAGNPAGTALDRVAQPPGRA